MNAHARTHNNRSTHPPFPEPGSVVGPDAKYFCLGRLGKGTFCAIHKCVDLSHPHSLTADGGDCADEETGTGGRRRVTERSRRKQRIVAAKVELANFVDSGVIDGEASVLKFLDASLPPGMVPTFVDYVRQPAPSSAAAAPSSSADGGLSAIIMEYLPGEDMHLLRDRHCQALLERADSGGNGDKVLRRLSIEDAVYLVADVMLPLLKAMHKVGMVHRDVKPSNVVRTGTTPADRKFKIVDFGLSKSFVVPKDSSFADLQRPWRGRWMSPSFSKAGEDIKNDEGMQRCVRIEREVAEFRGTSMYASLRVHQGKDHCPRDDIWGLLYVFCDLVSGGLPWMEYASARDRSSCQILKEMVVGERGREDWGGNSEEEGKREGMAGRPNPALVPKNGEDAMEWILCGSEYHKAKYKRDMKMKAQQGSSFDPLSLPALPEPLSLSKNKHYLNCLRKAFRHVASLGFVEMPNYDMIGQCLRGFLRDINPRDSVPSIDWKERPSTSKRRRAISNNASTLDTGGVRWNLLDEEDADPLDDTLVEAENDRRAAVEAAAAMLDDTSRSAKGEGNNSTGSSALDTGAFTGEASDLARLPLQIQFSLSQAEYNARYPDKIPLHLALRDWMALAVPLAHGAWDTASWERGNHRTDDDGYRNEVYMSMLQKCLDAAEPFNRFSDRECYYYPLKEGESKRKKRRVGTSAVPNLVLDNSDAGNESPLVVVSRVFFSLRLALDTQRGKNFAPPPKLSFGY